MALGNDFLDVAARQLIYLHDWPNEMHFVLLTVMKRIAGMIIEFLQPGLIINKIYAVSYVRHAK